MSQPPDPSLNPNQPPAPPEAEAPTPVVAPKTESTKGKAAIVSLAIMSSRIMGLVREVVLGSLIGANRFMDAYMVAFRTPNMLRDLFAEGALSTAFVTTFSKLFKTDGEASAWDLARKMITLTAVFMAAISVLAILIMPAIVNIMCWGWRAEQPDLIQYTIFLSRIIYPFILLVSLAALIMGMLNARGVFFWPAMASTFFNVGSIVSGAAIGYWLDGGKWGRDSLIGFSIGVVIGGLCQLLVQLPSLRTIGFKFRPDFKWNDPQVKKVLSLMGPSIIAGSAVQVGVALNTFFAGFLEAGSISYLQFSFRLMQLPIGIFGVAVATVTLPAISRAATDGITEDFRIILSRGVRLVLVLTVPSALGLAMLAEPIISIIWERKNFTHDNMLATASALRCFAMGLVFYAGIKVIQPAFYAIEHKWVPMIVSIIAILVNVALNSLWVFYFKFGHEFLALSTAIGSTVNFSLLYLIMWKYAKNLQTGQLLSTIARLAIACAALGGTIYAGQVFLLSQWYQVGFLVKAGYLTAVIGAASVVYLVVAKMLRIEELDEVFALVRRRRRRG